MAEWLTNPSPEARMSDILTPLTIDFLGWLAAARLKASRRGA